EPFAGASPAPTPGESPILSRREPSSWRQPPPSQRVPVPQSELPTETPALVSGPRQSVPALHSVLEEERIHRLVEGLKSPDQQEAAAELAKRGSMALPAL